MTIESEIVRSAAGPNPASPAKTAPQAESGNPAKHDDLLQSHGAEASTGVAQPTKLEILDALAASKPAVPTTGDLNSLPSPRNTPPPQHQPPASAAPVSNPRFPLSNSSKPKAATHTSSPPPPPK